MPSDEQTNVVESSELRATSASSQQCSGANQGADNLLGGWGAEAPGYDKLKKLSSSDPPQNGSKEVEGYGELGQSWGACGLQSKEDAFNSERERCICEYLYGEQLRVLEEEARVEFRAKVFLLEFFYHMFYPLSLPFLYLWEGGLMGIRNRMFLAPVLGSMQMFYGLSFFFLIVMARWRVSSDIYMVTFGWTIRNMVVATKYAFVSKSDMRDMRTRRLPSSVHFDRTLLLSWLNPIPPRVVKRQLLLAAVRQRLVRCTNALRLVPGASQRTVCEIMHQLSITSTKEPLVDVALTRRRSSLNTPLSSSKSAASSSQIESSSSSRNGTLGAGESSHAGEQQQLGRSGLNCPTCLARGTTEVDIEARWVNICMRDMGKDPKRVVPKKRADERIPESKEEEKGERKGRASERMLDQALAKKGDVDDDDDDDCGCDLDMGGDDDDARANDTAVVLQGKVLRAGGQAPCPALDLPVLFFAAYLIQQSMLYVGRKRANKSISGNQRNVRALAYSLALVHALLPFAARSCIGDTPTFGGSEWYDYAISFASFIVSGSAMLANVMFMMAGVLDMRRRAFCAHLLNRLLKDGLYRPSRFGAGVGGIGGLTLSAGLDGRLSSGLANGSYNQSSNSDSTSSSRDHSSRLPTSSPRHRHAPASAREPTRRGGAGLRRSVSEEVLYGRNSGRRAYGLGLVIDFSHPESCIAWWTTRTLVQDFGQVFYMRVKYYASYFAMYCMLLVLFFVIEVLTMGGKRIYNLVSIAFDVIVFAGLLGLMVFPAGETNDLHHLHGQTLMDKKLLLLMHMRKNRGAMSAAEIQQATDAHEALTTLCQAVIWDNQITKVTVVGLSAGSQWIGLLLGMLGVAITIAAQQFTNRLKTSADPSPPPPLMAPGNMTP